MWQWYGSPYTRNYREAKEYIEKLKHNSYGDYSDWRFPTLEEAMSLVEPNKQRGLYINQIFDNNQKNIWTCDFGQNDNEICAVSFTKVTCFICYVKN